MLDELKYIISGSDAKFGKIRIHNPSLSEIRDYGEHRYIAEMSAIILRPYDAAVMLDEVGMNYQEVKDYDLFLMTIRSTIPEPTLLMPDVIFGDFEHGVNPENGTPKVTLSYKPVGEVKYIYSRNTEGGLGTKYAMDSTAGEDTFAIDPATGVITVPTTLEAGAQIMIFYDVTASNGKRVSNYADKFSQEGKLVATVMAKSLCDGKSYVGKVVYPRCKASGNFEMTFGDEFSVQSLEFEALASNCAGATNTLWDFYIFDQEDLVKVS